MGLTAFYLMGSFVNFRVILDLTMLTQLPRTPGWAVAILMYAVVAYAGYFGPEVIARAGEVLLHFVVPGLALIIIPTIWSGEWGRLAPLRVADFAQLDPLLTAAFSFTLRGFAPGVALLPFLPRDRRLPSAALAGVLAGALVIFASLALPTAVLGPALAARLRYPFLTTVATTEVEWLPFEQLVVVLMVV